MYTINIGLDNPFTGGRNTVDQTIAKTLTCVSGIYDIKVSHDGAEPTVIIRFERITGSLAVLSAALDQDCIAVRNDDTNEGQLYGDKAEAWGAFNPEYFQTI
jgi:hypothetical protein